MHDLVIRGGTVVDGTGALARRRRRVDDGTVSAVGSVAADAREVMDAAGMVVTPGFVDVHTHYDGQVTWTRCSTRAAATGSRRCSWATAAWASRRWRPTGQWLIGLMEGVEDIPGTALAEGIRWSWETFPEFLDAVDAAPLALDVGAQVPHGAVRAYVMGERSARNEAATSDDIAEMTRIVREAIEAGAVGVSTRAMHRATDGEPVPGTFAAEDELFGIGRALEQAGRGVFELAPAGIQGEDLSAPDRELDWMRRLAAETGRPVTFGFVQHDVAPDDWRRLLKRRRGGRRRRAVAPAGDRPAHRPAPRIQTFHPLNSRPTYAALAPAARRASGRPAPEPTSRSCRRSPAAQLPAYIAMGFERIFELGDPPEYEPRQASVARAPPSRASTRQRCSTTCCSGATAASCSCARCSATATTRWSRCARCCCTASVLGIGDGGARARHLRCQQPDLHAHALGARPHETTASRSRPSCTR